ncbi:MAG: hypothetical protein KIG36_00030 [Eubacteriales bacterium]|nr:hypothetical protein [Eubacteriales bacterium]
MKNQGTGDKILRFILGIIFFLIFRIDSLLYSLPAWVTLILHFTVGLDIMWFWLVLITWFVAGILRYLLIRYARWGGNQPDPEKENKNPYSHKEEP